MMYVCVACKSKWRENSLGGWAYFWSRLHVELAPQRLAAAWCFATDNGATTGHPCCAKFLLVVC